MREYIAIIKEKMGISDDEFEAIMASQIHQHDEYKIDKLSILLRKIISR